MHYPLSILSTELKIVNLLRHLEEVAASAWSRGAEVILEPATSFVLWSYASEQRTLF
jgi:hypothetical protein